MLKMIILVLFFFNNSQVQQHSAILHLHYLTFERAHSVSLIDGFTLFLVRTIVRSIFKTKHIQLFLTMGKPR